MFLCTTPAARAQSPPGPVSDAGTFTVVVAGKEIGTETFEIRSRGDRIEAQASLDLSVTRNGKLVHFQTRSGLILDSTLDPVTYRWAQKTPGSSRIQIDFGPRAARVRYDTVQGRRDIREFKLRPDTVILDDNLVHQYELLVMRYDRTAGGRQSFQAFVPQEAVPGVVRVETFGAEPASVAGRQIACRHLAVSTDLARIDLWVGPHEQLEKMAIASSELVAVRNPSGP